MPDPRVDGWISARQSSAASVTISSNLIALSPRRQDIRAAFPVAGISRGSQKSQRWRGHQTHAHKPPDGTRLRPATPACAGSLPPKTNTRNSPARLDETADHFVQRSGMRAPSCPAQCSPVGVATNPAHLPGGDAAQKRLPDQQSDVLGAALKLCTTSWQKPRVRVRATAAAA